MRQELPRVAAASPVACVDSFCRQPPNNEQVANSMTPHNTVKNGRRQPRERLRENQPLDKECGNACQAQLPPCALNGRSAQDPAYDSSSRYGTRHHRGENIAPVGLDDFGSLVVALWLFNGELENSIRLQEIPSMT